KRHANLSARYVRDPLQALLDDPGAWKGRVGESAAAAGDDIHVAHGLGVNVLDEATDRGLALSDVLNAVKRARHRMLGDMSWREAADPAAAQVAMFRDALDSELTAGETAEASAKPGPAYRA